MTAPTQVTYPAKTTVRTVVQVVLGLAVAVPFLVDELGLEKTGGVVAVVLATSAVITRIMAIPGMNAILAKYVGLGAEPLGSPTGRKTT